MKNIAKTIYNINYTDYKLNVFGGITNGKIDLPSWIERKYSSQVGDDIVIDYESIFNSVADKCILIFHSTYNIFKHFDFKDIQLDWEIMKKIVYGLYRVIEEYFLKGNFFQRDTAYQYSAGNVSISKSPSGYTSVEDFVGVLLKKYLDDIMAEFDVYYEDKDGNLLIKDIKEANYTIIKKEVDDD